MRATAQKIIFKESRSAETENDALLEAEGVEFKCNGALHVVRASREVVLCAG